jgi:hypothetical protein
VAGKTMAPERCSAAAETEHVGFPMQYKRAARFPAGNYSLQAELTTEPSDILKSMLKTTNIWTGRANSNTVEVQFASEFLAPLDDYPR